MNDSSGMYLNWQIDRKGFLTLVLSSSKKGVLLSRMLKFNRTGSAIAALMISGRTKESVIEYLAGHGVQVTAGNKKSILDFMDNAVKQGLGSCTDNKMQACLNGLKPDNNEKPRLLVKKAFQGPANEKWYKHLGRYASHEQFFYPIKVDFDITRECNLKCVFCYHLHEEKSEGLPLDRIKMVADRLREANVQVVKLIGGEPFLRKDIFEIIRYFREKGLLVMINTNGTLLDNDCIAKLKQAGLLSLNVSIDGDNVRTFSQLKDTGAFDVVVNNMRNAVKAGLPVEAVVTVNRINFFRLPFIYRLLNRLGVRMAAIVAFHAIGSGRKNRERLSISAIAFFLWVRLCKYVFSFSRTKTHIMACDTNSYMHLDHRGSFHFCTQIQRTMPLGNVFENDLLDLWHSDRYKQFFEIELLAEPCRSCIFKKIICNSWRCRAEAYAKSGNFFDSKHDCLLGKIHKGLNKLIPALKTSL